MTECKMLNGINNGDLVVLDLDLEFDLIVIKWDDHEVFGKYVYNKGGLKDFKVADIMGVIKINKSGIGVDNLIDKLNEIKKEITC